jgi:hypothetical protein
VARNALSLVILLVAPASAEEGRHSRATASSNAEYGIVLREEGQGKCRVEVTRDTDPAWTLPRCVGGVDDLYFISDSGQRFWVLITLPKSIPPPPGRTPVGETQKKAARKLAPHDGFGPVTVAVLYDRLGNQLAERTLGELMPKSAHRKLRLLDRRFGWLEGLNGIPGREPRVTEHNQVEFDTVEPKTRRLDFQE